MMGKSAQAVTRRGYGRPPKNLARLIELVNAERLYERELEDVHKKLEAAMGDTKNVSTSPRDLWIRVCGETAAKLRQETRTFLGPVSHLQDFLERYELLNSAANVLQGVTKLGAVGSKGQPSELKIRDARWTVDVAFTVPVVMVVDERGQLAIKPENPLVEALVGIPVERIRACAICRRLYWAPRINSECCGEKCRKTYNQRNSRRNRQVSKRKRARKASKRREE